VKGGSREVGQGPISVIVEWKRKYTKKSEYIKVSKYYSHFL